MGGETPVRLAHEAAARIVQGEDLVAAIVGGEAVHAVQPGQEGRRSAAVDAAGLARGGREVSVQPFCDEPRRQLSGVMILGAGLSLLRSRNAGRLGPDACGRRARIRGQSCGRAMRVLQQAIRSRGSGARRADAIARAGPTTD